MKQVDLTFPAEGFNDGLLFGAVVTQYSDGEIFLRSYDVDTTLPGGGASYFYLRANTRTCCPAARLVGGGFVMATIREQADFLAFREEEEPADVFAWLTGPSFGRIEMEVDND